MGLNLNFVVTLETFCVLLHIMPEVFLVATVSMLTFLLQSKLRHSPSRRLGSNPLFQANKLSCLVILSFDMTVRTEVKSMVEASVFMLKKELNPKSYLRLIKGEYEYLFLELTFNGIKIAFGVVYRPPWSSVPGFVDNFDQILTELSSSYARIVISGDYNIDINSFSSASTNFLTTIDRHCLKIIPSDNTCHFLNSRSSKIDLMLVSDDKSVNHLYQTSAAGIMICSPSTFVLETVLFHLRLFRTGTLTILMKLPC